MKQQPLILTLLHARNQVWLFHIKTRSYAEHKTLGELYEQLDEFIDTLTESLLSSEALNKAFLSDLTSETLPPLEDYTTLSNVVTYLHELEEYLLHVFTSDTNLKDHRALNNLYDGFAGELAHAIGKLIQYT